MRGGVDAGSTGAERRLHRRVRPAALACSTAVAAVVLGLVGPAAADPGHPSARDVQRSRDAVAASSHDVGRIEARLAVAGAQADRAAAAVGRAVEAYNGARLRLQQARARAVEAQQRADLSLA